MKQVWISDDSFNIIKKVADKIKRPMSSIIDLVLTKEINLIKNTKELNELFIMIKQ